jgi:prepilin-type N-terminal cleavage/methylation domain-containing protein
MPKPTVRRRRRCYTGIEMVRKGFNLIEMLIGVGLVGVLLISVNTMLASTLGNSRKSDAISLAETEGKYAMRTMEQEIKFAQKVQCVSPSRLRVTRSSTDVIEFLISGGRISFGTAMLTDNKVAVLPGGGDCGGAFVNCHLNGTITTSVDICFTVDKAGTGDATDFATRTGSGVPFRTSVGVVNSLL